MDDARIELEARERRDSDLEVESIQSEVDDYESSPAEYEISTYPADFTLEVLWSKWKANDIIVPQFQRQFVWKHVQASKLIESFLAGLPVPAIFLYVERVAGQTADVFSQGNRRRKSLAGSHVPGTCGGGPAQNQEQRSQGVRYPADRPGGRYEHVSRL